jgi:plasmid maintenance system antidote protein VapI
MSYPMDDNQDTAPTKGFSGKQVLLFVLGAVLLTAGLSFWLIRTYIHPGDFKPVSLSAREQGQLDDKLRQLGVNPRELLPNAKREDQFDDEGRLVPEKYSEDSGKRDIRMSERELNALVANNPELAKRFAIDLSDNLASAKLLIPVDPDMPVLGGRILRVNAGIEVAYREERPVVKLRGISVMGVPVPNAWLGNLKNVDLVQEFGTGPGFWNSFAAGVDLIEVVDGELHIKLRE